MKDRVIVALDVDSIAEAKRLVKALYPVIKIFKIGNQLFTRVGPQAVEMVHKHKAKVFLDLKYHDIPNTVANAVKSACEMGVLITNLHASGGQEMMQQAANAKKGKRQPLLLAVTVLTSLDKQALNQTGIHVTPLRHAEQLALLAKRSGMDGVVCAGNEIEPVRKACGKGFIILAPGIRMQADTVQDQKRVMTPGQAINKGADYIVVGRPITQANNPLSAAIKVLEDIKSASTHLI
jgi:orotidine-5'-phosphate decarboxylase